MIQKGVDLRSDKSATPRKFNRNEESPEWVKNLPRYDNPNLWLAIEQLVGTLLPHFLLLSLMFVSIRPGVSYRATFLLALMAVPFYMRIFIFFHDCGHGSFFMNRKANTILAYVCGILTFMRGASFYKLPPILQWATGNIGFHYAHHVSPRIPNYNLPKCFTETRELHIRGVTLRRSLDALFLSLWDEDKKNPVGFRDIKELKRK